MYKRYSKQRTLILEIVKSTHSHPSADWIYNKARKIMTKISRGTVYRNLNQLAENGEINVIKDGDVMKYDGNILRHDHLLCTKCDSVYDINILPKDLDKKVQRLINFDVKQISLTIEGICQNH
tara:strand:+ start:73 stop:441 length:369 start_codon:yes stop_codon:yes gene_type:complete